MFSFLSNWRQTPSSSDGDSDVSSLNRSLNLPWPVTESSRKNKNEGTATRQQQQPANGMNVRDISYPMPKKASTRPDDHSVADGLPGPSAPPTIGATNTPPLHPFIAAPAPSSESVPWFQESAARRKNNYNLRTALLQANARAQHASITNANATPEVVRVDSNDAPYPRPQRAPTVYHDDPNNHASYDTYDTHPYANGISNPSLYANYPYAQQTSHNDQGDQHEVYASPFGHSDDDEDAFFRGPQPSQTRTLTPTHTSRWGGLKLHTASPFSQSTLQVDGLIFPPPPDTISHNLPAGVLPPSLPLIPTVNTDVYNHAYNYPLAKQLSPIAEQDYFSPISVRALPGSAASASPGADSVLNFGFGNGNGNGNGKEKISADDKDRERDSERGSTRTRSGRAGSVDSVKAPAMRSASGSGSLSMKESSSSNSNPSSSGPTNGFEVTRKFSSSVACPFTLLQTKNYIRIFFIGPPPIYASPFLTRHLNRTTSQTSSNKSDSPSQSQSQFPTPPPVADAVPAPPVSQPQPQETPQSNSPLTPTLSRITSQLSIGSSTPRLSTATITPANAFLKLSAPDTAIITTDTGTAGSAPTPTSAATTTTGTMYTPNSAFPAPTPTSPTSGTTGAAGVQIPAITILPCIPPLDLRPFFPGPHPSLNLSADVETPRLRPLKKREVRQRLSVIRGSVIQSDEEDVMDDEDEYEEEEEGGGYDVESLHAESFVTATTNNNDDEDHDEKAIEGGGGVEMTVLPEAKSASMHSSRTHTSKLPSTTLYHSNSGNSTGESFIIRRWDRDAALGLSLSPTTFRERKHRFFITNSSFITNSTPAFWAFWLGFLFPVLWLVGGWHFTNLGEQPPKSTVWEWYFWRMGDGWWKRVFVDWRCFGMKKGDRCVEGSKSHKRGNSQQQQQIQMQLQEGPQKRIPRPRTKDYPFSHSKLRCGKVFPALPRWVAEKQSTDDGRMRLNDPKRSLKGILFGYPFISRPPSSSQGSTLSSSSTPPGSSSLSVTRRVLNWIEKPNRILDQLYGVKLREVRGRPESGRRMFDPWIQRCRYAFCWIMLVVAIGLCTASVYLIAENTKRL